MDKEERIEAVAQQARKNFSLGYNCSECVFRAALEMPETNLSEEFLRLATGFGGGVGLYGDTCGAVAGAVMAASAVHGRSRLPEGEDRREIAKKSQELLYDDPGLYKIFNQIPNLLREKYGNTLCRELSAKYRDEWLCREHALRCREIITDAARFAARLMLATPEEIRALSYGENVENLDE